MNQSISNFCLKLNEITVIRGKSVVFYKFNINFFYNKINVLSGKNGVGKTTLLRTISGLIIPNDGRIVWDNNLNNHINYVSHVNGLSPSLTVKENIENWLNLFNINVDIKKILSYFNLELLINKKVNELSEGQKKKVSLSRLFINYRKVWILDEPYESLDESSKIMLSKFFLKHINSDGVLIISSNQNIRNIPKDKLNIIQLNSSL